MKRAIAILAATVAIGGLSAGTALACGGRSARAHTTFAASPQTVVPGRVVRFHGQHWGTGEFCPKAQVTLMVKAGMGQLGIFVGQAKVRSDGSWKVRWQTPADEQIGTSLTILAREYCESGKDGSTIAVERTVKIHFTGRPA